MPQSAALNATLHRLLAKSSKRYTFYTIITFEFDPKESLSNAYKHGIDFEQAQALWDDPDLLIIDSKALDEPRQLVIGMIDGKHSSVIITDRPPNTRIISVRRSRKSEVDIYESK